MNGARGRFRWVILITAADGTQSVAGAYYDIDAATADAAMIEERGYWVETAVIRLEQPRAVIRSFK